MEFNAEYFKYFLIFDGIVVVLIVIWLFRRPKNSSKMILKMNKGASAKPRGILEGEVLSKTTPVAKAESAPASSAPKEGRSLTVQFIFNGHNFEAFETLGLPAGSSYASAQTAFEKASTADNHSREFLKAALEAIRKNQS